MQHTKPANLLKPAGYASTIDWNTIVLTLIGALALLSFVVLGEIPAWLLPFRAILGAIYLLFVPGFFLSIALFPSADALDSIERAALSIGLSIASMPLLALLLDQLPWGITLWPILIAVTSLTALAMLVASLRTANMPGDTAYRPQLAGDPRLWWGWFNRNERRTLVAAAACLVLMALSVGWIFFVPSPAESMTEFYVLGKAGNAEDYPRKASVLTPVQVTVGIHNLEGAPQSYRAEVWASDAWDTTRKQQVATYGPVVLAANQEVRVPLSWQMPWAGADQKVTLLLYRGGEQQPYRHLELLMNVE